MQFSYGQILARCGHLLDLSAGVQLHEAVRLLDDSAWLQGARRENIGEEERAWSELNGYGPYQPPVLPFPINPQTAALILVPTADALADLTRLLLLRYSPSHIVQLVELTTDRVTPKRLADLVAVQAAAPLVLAITPLALSDDRGSFERLAWVIARLYAPGGCPWDRRQSHRSLRNAVLEEAYEVIETLDNNDQQGLCEELGDLLIAIISHSEMARQAGSFQLGDVLEQVSDKLMRRHPHVFGDLAVSDSNEVLANWEAIKAQELAAKGRSRESAIDGIPVALPAVATAQQLAKKAGRAGFEWADLAQVWGKLDEELAELRSAVASGDEAAIHDELGDVLATTVKLAYWLKVDAETALREANAKFCRRFRYVEQAAAAQGTTLTAMSLEAMLTLWNEAKVKREVGSVRGELHSTHHPSDL
ncbi:nucleoside triphosphate pyrophosphohydrolase [Candidatus Gracilibacteria bacterium]|nr:nucleoside triphosphate pyrophosphohydrolase [Candidatus Gracilibacteria bacterium]